MSFPRSDKFPTVNADEMALFKNISTQWWDKTVPLQSMNNLRVPWIVDGIAEAGLISKDKVGSSKPLEGLKILEVGCGGGIFSEPLSQYGCTIVGIDPCTDMIHIAKQHMALNPSLTNIRYINETIEEHSKKYFEEYDAVVATEVLDHVDERDLFLDLCCRCLKPGGPIFVTTINKTWTAWLTAIILLEYIVGIIPKGTHSYYKFITPEDVEKYLENYNCRTKYVRGMLYNFLTSAWHWSSIQLISYALYAIKDKK
ncbi:hypothetical protein ILUMI_24256 [Ignelater luminosus]|uniref:Ubiquinone biosynthesis O-methyltransferase, mitochondrial n=1 Tax=Ignelater luminosus TaxID=2038154 RepID=A0A8K0CAW5_IGNLU|nr:hypothetical protein ILUMI_24256 [Ignelater luminosus]